MVLEEPGHNVVLAAFHARRLREFALPNWSDVLDAVMRPMFGPAFQSRSFYDPLQFPKMWYGGDNTRKVLYIDGVKTNGQAGALWNAYDDSPIFGGFSPVNLWLRQGATFADAFTNQNHVVVPEYLDVVGYSAGGAIAVALKDKWIAAGSVVKSRAITFGSPRTGNADMKMALSRSSITRWMNDNDPVPLIPPRILDVPGLLLTSNFLTITRYGNYVHQAGGIEISATGITSPRILPTLASIHATTSLLSWLIGIENDMASGHAIDAYVTRLLLAESLAPRPAEQNVAAAPAEVANVMDRRGHNRQEDRVITAINNAGHGQNIPSLFIPPQTLFRAVRINRIWNVTFGDQIIASSPIEKRARSLARSGNAFLRKLPRQALVNPDALATQFISWLTAAIDPMSGIVPTINIGLPL